MHTLSKFLFIAGQFSPLHGFRPAFSNMAADLVAALDCDGARWKSVRGLTNQGYNVGQFHKSVIMSKANPLVLNSGGNLPANKNVSKSSGHFGHPENSYNLVSLLTFEICSQKFPCFIMSNHVDRKDAHMNPSE